MCKRSRSTSILIPSPTIPSTSIPTWQLCEQEYYLPAASNNESTYNKHSRRSSSTRDGSRILGVCATQQKKRKKLRRTHLPTETQGNGLEGWDVPYLEEEEANCYVSKDERRAVVGVPLWFRHSCN